MAAAGRTFAAGFHTVLLPLSCDADLPTPTDPGDCGVALGRSCGADEDCGDGVCLTSTPWIWPHGTCAQPFPAPNGCRPGAGAHVDAPPGAGVSGYYVLPCRSTRDCRNDYVCDSLRGACLPSIPPLQNVSLTGVATTAYCAIEAVR